MNVADILTTKARESPQCPALIATIRGRDHAVTFGELDQLTARAAALLQSKGLKPGDVVLVFQPMSIDLYVALLAIFRVGLVGMFLDPSAGREHIESCCAMVPPRGFIGSDKSHWLRLVAPSLRRIPNKFSIGIPVFGAQTWTNHHRSHGRAEIESLDPEATALITFTSGSTGEPKAALRTHRHLIAQHDVLQGSIQLSPGETELSTLPIFVLANLASGVTSIIADANLRNLGNIDPVPVLRQIQRHQPSRMTASPAFLGRLLDACENEDKRLESFTKIYVGGGPVFPRLMNRLRRNAPRADIVAVFGSTEAEPIALCSFSEIDPQDMLAMEQGKGLLAGKPIAEIALRIIPNQVGIPISPLTHEDFARLCQPDGEPGEIVVCGAHVIKRCLHWQGNEKNKIQVGSEIWHRTGDAGFLDSEGRVWLLGRCAASIYTERGLLYPMPVECVAQNFPWVVRSALISLRGRNVLILESKDVPEEHRLTALRHALKGVEVEELRVVKRIPTDYRHNAKIDYPRLQRMFGAS